MKRAWNYPWSLRRYILKPDAYQRGQTSPDIPSGGTGIQPNYMSTTDRGYAQIYYDEDLYTTEKLYLSAPYISDIGNYRIGVLFKRATYYDTSATAYTFIAECGSDGRLLSYSSGSRTHFDSTICSGTHSKGWLLNKTTGYKWSDVVTNYPLITAAGVDLTDGTQSTAVYAKYKDSWTADIETLMFTFCDKTSEAKTTDSALTPTVTTPDPNDICERMKIFSDTSKWCYWYGGSGELASESVLARLAAAYPGYYTPAYIANCRKDIEAGRHISDCSYAVSYAYNISRVDTWWFSRQYCTWTGGTPKNGMILVRRTDRNGHVAIYQDGHTMEMSSQTEDYQEKPYDASKWTRIAYDPNRSY